ncbi:MAG: pyridoxal phosphate-dependent aminotransferase [Clostridium sp.]|nr:pyridoxal phosphate-dependent aminotransferase [Clostridium sp.]
MEKFDFDRIVPRRGTNSYKWDSAPSDDILPMWVADMDFQTAPCIIEALQRRVAHGIFGYTRVPDRYFDAVIGWFGRRHGWKISRDEIIYTSGVVPAISAVIKALAHPGEGVIVQTPVYNCFFSSIRNNGCRVVENPLVYNDGRYSIDFDDLEAKASAEDVTLLLLCNPHNPAGRVWTRDELDRINRICKANGVLVISDEIHGELVFPGHRFVPFASVSEECSRNSVTCNSPSKAFNTAGLQIANIISCDPQRRSAIDRAININEVCDVNPFGVEALIAAYSDGEPWLAALNDYLCHNYLVLREFFDRELPGLTVTEMEGTYLVWVDCRPLGLGSDEIEERLMAQEKLWLNSGTMYGKDGFMRINIACPRRVMLDGLGRLLRFVRSL